MHTIPPLEDLGYSQLIDTYRLEYGSDIEQVARVTAEHKGSYEIACSAGNHRATVAGRRMLEANGRDDYPAVGDWVLIKQYTDENKVIIEIFPRKTTLHKKYGGKNDSQLIATNVDVVFIVESIDRDYNLNRFERYVVLAREGGVVPVIVVNKSDLATKNVVETMCADINKRFGTIDVIMTSTITDAGLDKLNEHIKKGKTYCFLGSSGVGKSSLINVLLRQDLIATKAIGVKTGRGRHTTTAREMYIMANGGIIIDNPGSREVGVVDSVAGVGEVFADIDYIAKTCKFKNCIHIKEPGCAVVLALNTGLISTSKYENYQKLQKETKHYELSSYEKRQKDKKFGKFIKNAKEELQSFK